VVTLMMITLMKRLGLMVEMIRVLQVDMPNSRWYIGGGKSCMTMKV
jgi:hypothetical protein